MNRFKATLEFSGEDAENDLRLALAGRDLWMAITEWDNAMRAALKYTEVTEEVAKVLENYRELFREALYSAGVGDL